MMLRFTSLNILRLIVILHYRFTFYNKELHRIVFKNCCHYYLCPMSVYIPSLKIC